MTPPPSPARRVLSSSPFQRPAAIPAASTRMNVGDRVTHDRLGLGRVVRLVDDLDVIVDFGAEDGSYRTLPHTSLTTL